MRKLPKPLDESDKPYVPLDVFKLCISKVTKADFKARLGSIHVAIQRAGTDYDTAAEASALYKEVQHGAVGTVSKTEMVKVYDDMFAKQGRPGRPVYDRIISVPQHGRCPLCNLGTVKTLDHHLPKTRYPRFSVTPNNLVPSCEWCQSAKRTGYPTKKEEQTLHPYFDDFESIAWLKAGVNQGTPAVFEYEVSVPDGTSDVTAERLNEHLKAYSLKRLYSSNAASLLSGVRARLNRLFEAGGSVAVRDHLSEEANSWNEQFRNSWQGAMYRAASDSNWFCDGGFAEE